MVIQTLPALGQGHCGFGHRDLSGWLIRDQRFLSQRLWYKHIAVADGDPQKNASVQGVHMHW